RSGVALVPIRKSLVPDLLAGLHVECNQMIVLRRPKEFAVVNRRRASRSRAILRTTRRPLFKLDRRAPDLFAGFNVDREGPPAVNHVQDAVVKRWRRQFA